ncbi:MAG: hypothetical protein HRT36_05625 [Alphaproteobacteria bacterium]|nr:hypothetical protein [Alphaproteobacteria bacterium]
MRLLKFLVVFMAVLIVTALIFLVYAISAGLHRKSLETPTSTQITAPTLLGDHTVTLGDNQILAEHYISDERLILHIRDTVTEEQQWLVLDLTSGQPLGKIRLTKPE